MQSGRVFASSVGAAASRSMSFMECRRCGFRTERRKDREERGYLCMACKSVDPGFLTRR